MKDLLVLLAAHYQSSPGDNGPSWLTFPGHTRDSPWSIDLFRCKSILLKSHWVLVIMDQLTLHIVGFAIHSGDFGGVALCHMYNSAISSRGSPMESLLPRASPATRTCLT
jgi:putative transposase